MVYRAGPAVSTRQLPHPKGALMPSSLPAPVAALVADLVANTPAAVGAAYAANAVDGPFPAGTLVRYFGSQVRHHGVYRAFPCICRYCLFHVAGFNDAGAGACPKCSTGRADECRAMIGEPVRYMLLPPEQQPVMPFENVALRCVRPSSLASAEPETNGSAGPAV